MMAKFTAYIEKDIESDCYVAIVPGMPGAHTQADTLDELHIRLKEVIELCLEGMSGLLVHLSKSMNFSTVSPDTLINCLSRPGFNSLCFGTV